jgi:hypothetical protein
MQIGILNGIYTDGGPDFRTSYPVNLVPVPKSQGISSGYLRPSYGIASFGVGPGVDRGGIEWNNICYRVMGTKLVSISSDGTTTTLGDVGTGGQVTLDYSFDRLAIASGGRLYYWNGTTLTQVTDVDLGTCLDVVWVDGYFMSTDGTYLIVTELADPTQVNPLKYGSSEIDPDAIKAVIKFRNEIYALNRHTIEVFDNVGGSLFPFARIDGAQIQKGVIGTHACCQFAEAIAFVGSGRNEASSVYLGANGQAQKISTQEIDKILSGYGEAVLSEIVVESRIEDAHEFLIIHLPDRAVVYDLVASKILGDQVWFVLTSSATGFSQYRARNLVWCYDKWLCGDPSSTSHGYLSETVSTHFSNKIRWEFGTSIIYGESRGAIFHELELVCLTGRTTLGTDPQISTAYSTDGETWSQEKYIHSGKSGERNKRLVWFQNGHMTNWRIQRFKGDSDSNISIARLEAQLEPLAF